MSKSTYLIAIILGFMSCKEPYTSPVVSPSSGYLVVEGAINSGAGVTDISLSRTVNLNSRDDKFEKGALVKVEAEDGSFIVLNEGNNGHYLGEDLNLDNSKKYRLSISTEEGIQYLSDFLEVKKNPEIDSVDWERVSDGVQLNISTHDDQGNTRYYRWDFTETWEKFADYKSRIEYQITRRQGKDYYNVVYRPSDDGSGRFFDSTMYYCWKKHISNDLLLGTTAQLSKDQITKNLTFIPESSQKLERLYSILVKQYSLTKEAYEFLEVMKKNSELTGSIFDAQPAVLYGNIHRVNDPDEQVIGYMSICPIREKRIFIDRTEVSDWRYFSVCRTTTFNNSNDVIRDEAIESFLPISGVSPPSAPFPSLPTFLAAPPECVNCRLTGSDIKPDFWPETYKYD